MVLQGVFLLTFLVTGLIAVRLWWLHAVHRLPGIGWWALGCTGIGLASLLTGASPYVGDWARTMAAHISSIGGFCALWIGTRRFLGGSRNRFTIPLFTAFLVSLALAFYWFWLVDPRYQIRLTIDCLFLILFSFAMSQDLFSLSTRSWAGTAAGVLYMIFALINGFRTINIILFPVPGSIFLSNAASRNMTVAMAPVLLAALALFEFLVRDCVDPSSENDE